MRTSRTVKQSYCHEFAIACKPLRCRSGYIVGVQSIFSTLFSLDFLADYKPKYGSPLCWFNNKKGLAVFFALPLGAVVLENFVLFLFTIYGIHTQLRAARWNCQFL